MQTQPRLIGLLKSGTGLAIAIAVQNIATYGFNALTANKLGLVEYGKVASLLGISLIFGVVSLGLQATAARIISADPERPQLRGQILKANFVAAFLLMLLCLCLVPVITHFLNLGTPLAAVFLALSVFPLTFIGGCSGILQGDGDWGKLSLIYLTVGLPRVGLAFFFTQQWATTEAAMGAFLVGALIPALLGYFFTRKFWRGNIRPGKILKETGYNTQAFLAFFVLSNLDIILARAILPEHQAGLYGAGIIVTKTVLFLPQFVMVIVFPTMATATNQRIYLKALAFIFCLGSLAAGMIWLLKSVAIKFIGGQQYLEVKPEIFWFALLGTILSMIQLVVYQILAKQTTKKALAIWLGCLILILVSSIFVTNRNQLLAVAMGTHGLVLLSLVWSLITHPKLMGRFMPASPNSN